MGRAKKVRSNEHGLGDIHLVAYLLTRKKQKEVRQDDVAGALGIQQSRVSQLKNEAIERGILIEEHRIALADAWKERLPQLQEAFQERVAGKDLLPIIRRLSGDSLQTLQVVCSGRDRTATSVSARNEALLRFGERAAAFCRDLLGQAKVIGVSWGQTLLSIVRGLQQGATAQKWAKGSLQFFPVCGEPAGFYQETPASSPFSNPSNFSSTYLARELSILANGSAEQVPPLVGFPPILPGADNRNANGDATDVIRTFLFTNPAFVRVFGASAPTSGPRESVCLLHQMDALLTGIAGVSDPGFFLNDLALRHVDIKRDREEARRDWDRQFHKVAGDLAGVLIPKKGADDDEAVRRFIARCIGLQIEDIRRCAEKANNQNGVGVIIAAAGREKVEIALECLERGLVTHLLIDEDLTRALAKEAPKRIEKARKER